MGRKMMRTMLAIVCAGVMALPLWADTLDSTQGPLDVTIMAKGFATPWAIGFLPEGGFLVTEREGRLWRVQDGNRSKISGLPNIRARGQGGLMDILIPRDFAQRRQLFLTFAKTISGGGGTAVLSATLPKGGSRLQNVQVIFEMADGASGGRHFGSRLVESSDGSLFVTIGDRGTDDQAQSLSSHRGKILRISRSGVAPKGNPFTTSADAQPEIWSYGHRNPQGMAMDAQGWLWAVEHGAKGGDEVNLIQKGRNYGWPVISYGTHYSGGKIGEGTSKPGMEQPAFYWDPSIAPSGMMLYSGRLWPNWRGHMFIGSLKFDYISRLSGARLKEREQIKGSATARVRDIREAPDGSIWFIAEDDGRILRLSPAK
ncbi:PQQ-dependent sugar dehydrogenase [Shimia sediminis]|uniref:PQQ-dependent sugar dehydrogenase n=1 Tax=Shimia sediminis TaxID=2497945 RepID=UPI001F198766|nr:PQQ-dependent sugar dehydrogenase [Shimia sediminis]